MGIWTWFRNRPWWLQGILALPPLLAAVAGLYVAARAIQYASAEGDAGLFAPAGANVVLRARDLEKHWGRIRQTSAWRQIDRKVLRDPALRQTINGLLKDSGLPTLDDLEDVRQAPAISGSLLFRAAGRDAVLALRVQDKWTKAPWCAATRLRLGDFLLVPFAGWVLPTETIAGTPCLKVRQGGMELFVAIQGSVAVAGNDRAFLADALKARGGRAAPARPLALRASFEDSRALADLRRQMGDMGLFPFVRIETARGLEVTADIAGSAVLVDAVLEGAEPARAEPPPAAFAGLSPSYGSGFLLWSAGAREVYAWLKAQAAASPSKDFREAMRMMDEAGFASGFLPLVEPGIAVLLGSEERDGRLFPSVALILPSRNPREAVEAMTSVIQKYVPAGQQTEARMVRRPAGDTEMVVWSWPGGLKSFNDLFRPSYAALANAVALGNSETFTEAVIDRAAGRSEGLPGQGAYRRALEKLRAYGMSADSPPAGAFLFLPSLRESLDGLLGILAAQIVYAAHDGAKVRAEIDADLRRQGRTASEAEIVEMFNAAIDRRKRDQEELLRRQFRALDAAEWAAVQVSPSGNGVSVRAVVEFR